jgi:PAS domain S-box-containing protein
MSLEKTIQDPHDIIEKAPIGIFITTPQGRYTSANQALAVMLGYESPEELIASITDIATQAYVNPEDREEFMRLIQEHGEVVDHECRFKRKDGTEFWVSMNGRAVRDQNENTLYYQCFITDITERKRTDLRKRAEKQARTMEPVSLSAHSHEAIQQMFHELRVHQIELEMQNEELRTSQAEIEAGRERFFDFYDLAPVGYVTVSEKGLLQEANLTAATLLGVNRAALVKQPLSRFILKEDQDIYYLHRKKLFETGELQECELRLVKADCSVFWAYLRGTATQAKDGGTVCRLVLSDISGRKQAEEALRESEEKHRRLFETMAQGVIYQAADGAIISANPAGERILGLTFDQMQGKTSMDPRWKMIKEDGTEVPGEDHPAMIALRTGETVGPVVRGVFHPDKNNHIWLSITVIPLFQPGEAKPFQAYATFEDITGRKQAEDRLGESEEKYRQLVENQNDVFFATDENGRITYMSPSMESMSGYKPEKLVERDFTSLIYSGDIPCPRETFMREILTGERKLHEFRIISTSGELVWVRCSFKTMRINSRAAGLRGVLTDRSELSRLRLYFEKAQRVEVTGKCAAALAHEMKNLMTIIIGYSGFLLSSNPQKDFLRGDVIKIKEAGVKAARTCKKLLAFGRGQSFMPVILNINEVVHEMYDFIIPVIGKEIIVNISLDPGISSVEMDRSSLERIIINLVLNAKDAMPEGGYLSIETRNVQFEQAAFPDDQLSVSGPHVMLKISDTGTGMDQMTRSRVFEPFFSTKEPGIGTGLGLSSVYDSVIQARGRILVDSEPGEGSAFRVYLPTIES